MVTQRTWQRMLAPVWRRIRLILSRGVVRRSNPDKGLQRLQQTLHRGEAREMEHVEPYGYTARPLPGAESIVGAVGGVRSNQVALAVTDRRHRQQGLKEGEVCLYTDEGDVIHFQRGRIIRVDVGSELQVTAGDKVSVTAPAISANCDTAEVIASQTITAECDTATVTAATSVTVDAPDTTATGNLTVAGLITAQGGLAVTGGGGATVEGSMEATGDVKAGDVSLQHHLTTGVTPGSGLSGEPQ